MKTVATLLLVTLALAALAHAAEEQNTLQAEAGVRPRHQGNVVRPLPTKPIKTPARYGKYVNTDAKCRQCREWKQEWDRLHVHGRGINKNLFIGWLNHIPYCPCSEADAARLERTGGKSMTPTPGEEVGGWAASQHFIDRYHPGAHKCYRSGPAHWGHMNWAQQCCYNKAGKLITEGLGAGTADFGIGGANVGIGDHIIHDVNPFKTCCEECQSDNCDYCRGYYFAVRPADKGYQCPANSYASTSPWSLKCLPHHKCYTHHRKKYITLAQGEQGCRRLTTRNMFGQPRCSADGDCQKDGSGKCPAHGKCLCGTKHLNECRCVMEVIEVHDKAKMGTATLPYGVLCQDTEEL
eukprot:TRINITY_DN59635_c0_g2_i1.p1 TRINITY_DN59635_c0_g2~~TRINITY_DN59635_c0_g2_i1.p1  ORF type:complete len:365 (-),score=145.71 TRINITY_DN59635_c0_g2_i1:170-1222(-)